MSQEHHPNYLKTWAILVALLGLSLAVASLSKLLAVLIIFSVAVIKAGLVAGTFMHLRWEPRWLAAVAVAGFCCLLCLYLGVAPDIVVKPLVVSH